MPHALVTGAGVRVGRAIAEALARAGYDLLLHAHTSYEAALALALALRAGGGRAEVLAADLSTAAGVEALVAAVRERVDALDLLVNSAALYEAAPFGTVTRAAYARMQAVNVEAPFFLVQGLLPALRAAAAPAIVNVADAALERPYAGYAHYLVSKAGLAMLTRALALELAPGVRVNAVAPGAVAFPASFDAHKRERILGRVPLRREGRPEDVAGAVVFLAREALYVTGQILDVDGGFALA